MNTNAKPTPGGSKRRSLLQVIENMLIGGAQRSASLLADLPNVDTTIVTYDQLSSLNQSAHFDGLLLHVWRRSRYESEMNWPDGVPGSFGVRVAFNHDWCGSLEVGFDRYIVYSAFAHANTVADGPVYVVSGGIPTQKFLSLRRCVPASTKVTVGRLSTMWPGKIDKSILIPWRSLSASRFLIGGDGPGRVQLVKQFEDDPRFSFVGAVYPWDVPKFLHQIDIFLYDTTWHVESFCYATLEAMAAGCVVVARAKGALPSQIRHCETGFLFDTQEQAIKICEDLIRHPKLRIQIARRARAAALKHYPLSRFYKGVLDVMGWSLSSQA